MPPARGSTITRTRRARSTTTRQRASPSSSAQQIIWQGACLDGQHLFQLTNAGGIWQLYELNFTGANTASRKMVTTQSMFVEAFAALGSQYAMLVGKSPSVQRLANRSVRATAQSAIPNTTVTQPIATGNAVTARRVRRRTSVARSPVGSTAAAV